MPQRKKSKGGLILDIIKLVFDVMQTVSFMMFIEEEGIQIRGFGIMSLLREGLVDEVKTQLNNLETQIQNLETFVDSWGWIAPYMHGTYENYIQAAYDQLDAWRAWVSYMETHEAPFGIRIYSSPTHAEIWIDGEKTDYLTPHTFTDLSEGPHTFTLKYLSPRRGNLEYEDIFHIKKGEIKEVRCILEETS